MIVRFIVRLIKINNYKKLQGWPLTLICHENLYPDSGNDEQCFLTENSAKALLLWLIEKKDGRTGWVVMHDIKDIGWSKKK